MTQGQVRSSVSMVDTKLVTKQNAFPGEQDGQERWRTWSFMMRAYCAAHVTKLFSIRSVLMDDKALDTGRNCPGEKWSDQVALYGDVPGTKSILQSSKSAASEPGYDMVHLWYRRDTVADSLDRSSERLQATEQQQNILRVQE